MYIGLGLSLNIGMYIWHYMYACMCVCYVLLYVCNYVCMRASNHPMIDGYISDGWMDRRAVACRGSWMPGRGQRGSWMPGAEQIPTFLSWRISKFSEKNVNFFRKFFPFVSQNFWRHFYSFTQIFNFPISPKNFFNFDSKNFWRPLFVVFTFFTYFVLLNWVFDAPKARLNAL